MPDDMSSETSRISPQNDELLPFRMNHLPDFVLKKLKEELKETPETKLKSLLDLRKRLTDEPSTSGIDFHEDFLVQYLRYSKHDVERAFYHIQNMTVLRRKNPRLFQPIPDEFFLTKRATKIFLILPKRCPEGCTIVIYRYAKLNPIDLPTEDVIRIALLLFNQLYRDPMTQINGIKIIEDFNGTSLQQIKLCTPHNLYLVYQLWLKCIPGRYKAIHVINPSFMVKHCWTFFKPFLSEKIKKRVHFHSEVEELFDYFPRSVLPEEYGGNLKEKFDENWYRKANKEHEHHGAEGQANYF